ncbi:metallophosphoesterase family protein [Sinomonas sp. G460-2]|uniref:metallophosphoesterase family protein n=1 Tax=Sinomonas sp. G460-2 TaxID=3393464 RepID=UPI0039EF0248
MRIGVITDTHLAPAGTEHFPWHTELQFETAAARYAGALRTLRRHGPDVLVVLGDLTHFGDGPSVKDFFDITVAEAFCPILLVPGNHDIPPSRDSLADAFDTLPTGRHRIVDAVRASLTASGIPIHGVGLTPGETEGEYAGTRIPAPDQFAVVLSHYPILTLEEECAAAGLQYAGDLINRADLERALHSSGCPTVAFTGHLHVRAAKASGNILQIAFGALIEAPFDVAYVDIERNTPDGPTVRVQQLAPATAARAALTDPTSSYSYGKEWTPTA